MTSRPPPPVRAAGAGGGRRPAVEEAQTGVGPLAWVRDAARRRITDPDQRVRLRLLEGELWALRHRWALAEVEQYVLFVGYPRTGHTLVCAVLTAHPEVVVANELDALAYVDRGASRRALYGMILARDRWWTRHQHEWTGFDYRIAGQAQGSWTRLRVIGDKVGGLTSMRLGRRPELLDELRATVGVPLRFVHVYRHPLDTIARMARAEGWRIEKAADRYLPFARTVAELQARVDASEWIDVGLEQLIAEPTGEIGRLASRVGVEAGDDYRRACARIVLPAPRRSRTEVEWPPGLVERIASEVAATPGLRDYGFDGAAG